MQLTARRKRLKDELDAVEAVSQQYRLPKREPNVEASDEAKEEQARYMKTREGLLQRRGAILSQMRAEDNTILQLGRIIESYDGYEESPADDSRFSITLPAPAPVAAPVVAPVAAPVAAPAPAAVKPEKKVEKKAEKKPKKKASPKSDDGFDAFGL